MLSINSVGSSVDCTDQLTPAFAEIKTCDAYVFAPASFIFENEFVAA